MSRWSRSDHPEGKTITHFQKVQSLDEQGYAGIYEYKPAQSNSTTLAMSNDVEGDETEISAGQKMISAMSGSLLSSLLGLHIMLEMLEIMLTILVTPLDVVRIRLQSQPQSSSTSSRPVQPNFTAIACCREVFFANNSAEYSLVGPKAAGLSQTTQKASCVLEELQRKSFNSTFDGLRKIARHEGFSTLWRGLSPTLVMSVPANIIYFTGYDWLRFDSASPVNRIFSDNWSPLVAGSTARMVAGTVVSPIEMFRTRIQARRSTGGNHFAKTIKGLIKMVANDGYTSLWRGLTLTLWRDVPFSGIYWWGYETVRGRLKDARDRRRVRQEGNESRGLQNSQPQSHEKHISTFIDSFIAGATSGAVASIITMPFDVGKTRRQVFAGSKRIPGRVAPEERPMLRFLWHIFRHEGFAGLWRGWIPRTLKVAPACAIMISCYEVGKRVFRGRNESAGRDE